MELHLIQRTIPSDKFDPAAEARKRDRENGRLLALQHAEEALLTAVNKMRTSADEKIVLAACKLIMDRAWGTPKATPDEDPRLANNTMLGILASISIDARRLEDAAKADRVHPAQRLDSPGEGETFDG